MRKFLLAAFLVVLPLTALHAMSLETFLLKADALKARGMMAMFSRDLGLLKAEFKQAGERLKAERQAAIRAGRPTNSCPPPRARINSDEMLAYFRSIPQAQRQRMEVTDGLRSLLARRYPCPA